MNAPYPESATGNPDELEETSDRCLLVPDERTAGMHLSMHDGVAVWCDCCSCEAEPYWTAAAPSVP